MEYNRIIAITGLSGLYELLSSKADGAIVRSLDDKQTKFVSSRVHNFSHLESIEVYTVRENVNLVDLFNTMKSSKEALPAEKDAAAVKGYFHKVYPEMDFARVYNSDMKKMLKWYIILSANDVEFKLTEPSEETTEEASVEAPVQEVSAEEKPKKKAAPKKAAKASNATETTESATEEAAPKKKVPPKKKKSED